ncbi:hypothetical protein [Candidatus Methanoliparum sp. LAM-1]|uniref:hypothetical protein n=1 Tax=Candidatus Methanoliparum sp. LAM-1 TaxID=2874846 RepID=UPI001E65850A|nr:hypothetical protein [Candidatus Methanoliparum sp. LAM-1]BDC36552.1 hypothetical protein MTLP_12340 [Candidatus Methanoliparum sp. LAM-1]
MDIIQPMLSYAGLKSMLGMISGFLPQIPGMIKWICTPGVLPELLGWMCSMMQK